MILLYFVIFLGLIPFTLFLLYRRNYNQEIRNILPFVILMFFGSIYEYVGSIILAFSVIYWFIFYNIMAFITIFYFYYNESIRHYKLFYHSILIIFIILLLYLVNNYELSDFLIVNNFIKVFTTCFILLSTTLWFVKLIKESYINNLLQEGSFYFISAFVLYYCGTLFLFLLSDQLYKTDSSLFVYYWSINIFLNFVLRTLVIIGLWKLRIK